MNFRDLILSWSIIWWRVDFWGYDRNNNDFLYPYNFMYFPYFFLCCVYFNIFDRVFLCCVYSLHCVWEFLMKREKKKIRERKGRKEIELIYFLCSCSCLEVEKKREIFLLLLIYRYVNSTCNRFQQTLIRFSSSSSNQHPVITLASFVKSYLLLLQIFQNEGCQILLITNFPKDIEGCQKSYSLHPFSQ